jgi:predicted SprT family Zn-dependent metalloprotease
MNLLDAEKLARSLMALHGLDSWSFGWTRKARECGCCNFRTHTISLSRPITLANELPEVQDTILHEIAHAKTGAGAGHGLDWKLQAVALGAKPFARTSESIAPTGKYHAICPACGFEHNAYRPIRRSRLCAVGECVKLPNSARQLTYVARECK